MGAARTDAPPAALSRAEIREYLEADDPPPVPATPVYVEQSSSSATSTGKRCVHCAHTIMRRKGVPYCAAPFTCNKGPVAYTGPQQLRDLGLIP